MKRNTVKRAEGFPGQQLVRLSESEMARCAKLQFVSNLYPRSFGFFPAAPGHFMARPSGLSATMVHYCLKGSGWLLLNGRRHSISKGTAFAIPSDVPHSYGADERTPWSLCWTTFRGSCAKSFEGVLGISTDTPLLFVPNSHAVFSAYQALYSARRSFYNNLDLIQLSLQLASFLTTIARHKQPLCEKQRTGADGILQSIEFMKANLNANCALDDFARVASLSKSHYIRQFKHLTGAAPLSYFIHMKMSAAFEQLATTGMSVESVARSLGYENPLYFSRLFKKIRGIPPSKARHPGM